MTPRIDLVDFLKQIRLHKAKNNSLRKKIILAGSAVKWLEHRDCDQHSLGSKPTCAILLYPWEKSFIKVSVLGGLGKQF